MDKLVLIFIIIITLVSYSLDINNIKYKNINNVEKYSFYLFLLIHHFIASIIYFGWLFNNKNFLLFYILLLLIVLAHWLTNDLKCVLTEVINKYCNNDQFEPLHDIFYFVGLKNKNYFHPILYIYMIFSLIISVIKIIKF